MAGRAWRPSRRGLLLGAAVAGAAGAGKRASHLVSEGFVVPKVTKQRGSYDAALRYALAFYSDPVQQMVAEQRGTMPTVRKWIESKEYLASPPLNLELNARMLADRQLISGDIGFYHPQFRTWLTALRAETDKVFSGENAPRPGLAAGIAAADLAIPPRAAPHLGYVQYSRDRGRTWEGPYAVPSFGFTWVQPKPDVLVAYYFNRADDPLQCEGGVRHIAATVFAP